MGAATTIKHRPGGLDVDADGICDLFDACPDDYSNDGDADGLCAGTGFDAPADGSQVVKSKARTDHHGPNSGCSRTPNRLGAPSPANRASPTKSAKTAGSPS